MFKYFFKNLDFYTVMNFEGIDTDRRTHELLY